MRTNRFSLLGFLALLGLVLAACGGSDGSDTAATAGDSSSEPPAAGLVATTVDGGQFDFGDLEGQPALLWFWAPW